MTAFNLTKDQQAAYEAFVGFLMDPAESVFVLAGYAGTGKSTLVNRLLTDLPATLQTAKLLTNDDVDWTVALTATTNKAADALRQITGQEVKTIQSLLNLRVKTNYKTKETSLIQNRSTPIRNYIIFIDEASYIDIELLQYIESSTQDCKIIFIGDPAQLAPIKSSATPVFSSGYTQASLTEIVRQAEGNPIIDLATAFRNTVNGQPWEQCFPDGQHIVHLPRQEFNQEILGEFTRPKWKHDDSKVLAWTNKTVIEFNKAINESVQGVPELQVGDTAVCNSFLKFKTGSVKTDETVTITRKSKAIEHDTEGWMVVLNTYYTVFLPVSLEAKKARLKQARKDEKWQIVADISDNWADLRAAYACTINKSQGSTYDKVFIDLDDLKKCNSANNLARLMYVAVSRARNQIFLTGDLA